MWSGCVPMAREPPGETCIGQNAARRLGIVVADENAAREDSDRTLHNAHVHVGHVQGDAGLLEQGLHIADQDRIGGLENAAHAP